VKEMAARLDIMSRVKILTPMKWSELIRYTKTADAGLVLEKNTNVNYRFSLPNKLFDYISAGIPVIASDLPEISAVVTKYNCGIIIPGVTPCEISEAVEILRKNKSLSEELKKNAIKASQELNWERESGKVRDFYGDVINNEIYR
ncbi:MAG: glycosyltransferase family 4 protein, partial [Bacteroidales bacterium]|nr:glycosyltransferase family 4 protein [Bacteroidales bacterium]